MNVALAVELAARIIVAVALAYALAVALTHWAVRSGRLQPFGAWPRSVRRISDPVMHPLERRLVRMGRNPQEGPLWLVGAVILLGVLLLSLTRWVIATIWRISHLGALGPEGLVVTLVGWAFQLVIIALFVRVIGSWVGISPYARWMRPVIFLTEWIMAPIRRFMPPIGMIDLSPLVAYLALVILRVVVIGALRAVM